MRLLSSLFLGTLCLAPAFATPFMYNFDLLPADGLISGGVGIALGWGYQLTNLDPDHWLVAVDLSADSFSMAATASLFDFPILAPLASVTVPFDPFAGTGLYQIIWDSGTPPGSENHGVFILRADWYDNDPIVGNFVMPATDGLKSYSVTAARVPEPSQSFLLASGLAAVWLWLGFARSSQRRRSTGQSGNIRR